MKPARVVAALDVGSNTVRLLVARLEAEDGLVPLHYALRITRLAGGATPAGLAPESVERTVAAVADLARLMREAGATAWRAVATSAAREAPNAGHLIARARDAAGVDLEVISGDEEGALALRGIRWSLDRLPGGTPDRFAVVDIGGGSTEVLVVRREAGGWRAEGPSMPLGTVRLVERHLRHDPPTAEEMAAMAGHVEAVLAADLEPVLARALPLGAEVPLVGTAGAITTFAAMDLRLTTYDRARIDGHRLSRAGLEARLAELLALPAASRLALPGLERGREDLVVPGLVVLLAVMDRVRANSVTVVDAGLLEGVCLAISAARGAPPSDG